MKQHASAYPAKPRTFIDYHRRVERVVDVILVNPAQPFTVKDLAAHAGFSEFHFHRVFKAIAGESVAQCIIRLRLEAAASALVYQQKTPLTQIALECGFSDSAHLSKAFRKAHGCSPTQFRKDHPNGFRIRRIGKAITKAPDYPDDMNVNVDIQTMPERTLASLRLLGPYTHEGITDLYAELGQWYQSSLRRPLPDETVSITWSDPSLAVEDTLRLDACYAVPAGTKGSDRVVMRYLEGGRTACLCASLAASETHRISELWDVFLGHWLPQLSIEPADRPAYEVYRTNTDMSGFDITLCLPLKDAHTEPHHD
ncbi:GyrI-like domain-containing protein [Tateyamaria sp. syn59]|uniref:AraC family transcriptional regulator n=1 Tax=Tateyamaria sp. syn59 TaxID=2576942 RepID=UPI0011BFD659|nr:AraC family transcriptional regulator [Tateyamaria sp. syn59]